MQRKRNCSYFKVITFSEIMVVFAKNQRVITILEATLLSKSDISVVVVSLMGSRMPLT